MCDSVRLLFFFFFLKRSVSPPFRCVIRASLSASLSRAFTPVRVDRSAAEREDEREHSKRFRAEETDARMRTPRVHDSRARTATAPCARERESNARHDFSSCSATAVLDGREGARGGEAGGLARPAHQGVEAAPHAPKQGVRGWAAPCSSARVSNAMAP